MMTWLVIIFVVLVIGGAVALVVIGLRNPDDIDDMALQRRLEEFAQRGETVDLEKIELSQPFTERIIYPLARKVGDLATRFTPQNALNNINMKLELAGNPGNMDPAMFLTLQFFAAIAFGG